MKAVASHAAPTRVVRIFRNIPSAKTADPLPLSTANPAWSVLPSAPSATLPIPTHPCRHPACRPALPLVSPGWDLDTRTVRYPQRHRITRAAQRPRRHARHTHRPIDSFRCAVPIASARLHHQAPQPEGSPRARSWHHSSGQRGPGSSRAIDRRRHGGTACASLQEAETNPPKQPQGHCRRWSNSAPLTLLQLGDLQQRVNFGSPKVRGYPPVVRV